MTRKISRELLFQAIQRWHPDNPNRGYFPFCGYCTDVKNEHLGCDQCLCPKDICNRFNFDSLWGDVCRSLRSEECKNLMDKICDRLIEEWHRLGYGPVPEIKF